MFRHIRIAVLLLATLLLTLSNVASLGLCSCASGWERFFIGTCACLNNDGASSGAFSSQPFYGSDDLCDSAESARVLVASDVAHIGNSGHCHHVMMDNSDPYQMTARQQSVRPPLLILVPLFAVPGSSHDVLASLFDDELAQQLPAPPLLSGGLSPYTGWQCPMRA